jgi:hypothetical protein
MLSYMPFHYIMWIRKIIMRQAGTSCLKQQAPAVITLHISDQVLHCTAAFVYCRQRINSKPALAV